ncbi:substrate-binding periplasmic protein [Aeromonas sp. MdU4]|uniref:substrate-binding periplasmic protein n=1 Tax=Aeromonas sp. MdU4 TaxID=3342819 RepID=UPI0035BB5CC7
MSKRYVTTRGKWATWIGLLILLLSPALQASQTLIVAWSHWPPFSQLNSKGQLEGVDVTLTRQILTQAGFTPTFREMPWARSLLEVKHHQIDVIMAALPLSKHLQYARYSMPYRQNAYVLLSHNPVSGQRNLWPQLDSYSKFCHDTELRLGKLRGISPTPQMEECPTLKRATEYNKEDKLFELLQAHRLDGIIMEWQYARERLTQLGAEGEISCQLLLQNQPVTLMFANTSINNEQMTAINQAISALPKNDRQFVLPTCRLDAAPQASDQLISHQP